MQLAKLLVIDRRWGLRQQTLSALSLWESNNIPDTFCPRHQSDNPIKTESDPPVRRGAVLQSIE
jgi:hypothetical protein